MRRRYRIRSRSEDDRTDAMDEARDNVFLARRGYYDALDDLDELEAAGLEPD